MHRCFTLFCVRNITRLSLHAIEHYNMHLCPAISTLKPSQILSCTRQQTSYQMHRLPLYDCRRDALAKSSIVLIDNLTVTQLLNISYLLYAIRGLSNNVSSSPALSRVEPPNYTHVLNYSYMFQSYVYWGIYIHSY